MSINDKSYAGRPGPRVRIMRARHWINRNSTTATLVAISALVASLAYIATGVRDAPKPAQVDVYYYDLNTGELFVDTSEQFAPIESPSGPLLIAGRNTGDPAGVRAHVFACYNCSDESERFIGWLESFTEEARFAADDPSMYAGGDDEGQHAFDVFEQGHLIRDVDQANWVQRSSEAGFTLMEQAVRKCGVGEAPARECFPAALSR